METQQNLNTNQKIRQAIIKIIIKAKRAGTWKRITSIEKGILTLAVNLQIKFQSINLLRAITKIIKQIIQQTYFQYQNYVRGIKTANVMVQYATALGYLQAAEWVRDRNYITWWGIFLNPHTYTR